MGCQSDYWFKSLPLEGVTSIKPKLGSGYRHPGDYVTWHEKQGYHGWGRMRYRLVRHVFEELAARKQDLTINGLYMFDDPRYANVNENRHFYLFFKTEADWLFFYMYATQAPEEFRELNDFRAFYKSYDSIKIHEI